MAIQCSYLVAVSAALLILLSDFVSSQAITTDTALRGAVNATVKTSRVEAASGARRHRRDRCLSMESDLRDRIDSADLAFILAPARAAGTLFGKFADLCLSEVLEKHRNLQGHVAPTEGKLRGVIASRTHELPAVVRNVPRDTLLFYAHRKETSRVESAIAEAAWELPCDCAANGHCRGGDWIKEFEDLEGEVVGGDCYVSEDGLVGFIKRKVHEIGRGSGMVLTCDMYRAIKKHAPNMIFVDFERADDLQRLLAEKHCPKLARQIAEEPVRVNVAGNKDNEVYVRVDETYADTGGFNVTIEEWLETKSSLLELSIQLNDEAACAAKTRKMEKRLLHCEDGFLNATPLTAD